MPLSYAAILGGTCTLIGTSTKHGTEKGCMRWPVRVKSSSLPDNDPCEIPEKPALRINAAEYEMEAAVDMVYQKLVEIGVVE